MAQGWKVRRKMEGKMDLPGTRLLSLRGCCFRSFSIALFIYSVEIFVNSGALHVKWPRGGDLFLFLSNMRTGKGREAERKERRERYSTRSPLPWRVEQLRDELNSHFSGTFSRLLADADCKRAWLRSFSLFSRAEAPPTWSLIRIIVFPAQVAWFKTFTVSTGGEKKARSLFPLFTSTDLFFRSFLFALPAHAHIAIRLAADHIDVFISGREKKVEIQERGCAFLSNGGNDTESRSFFSFPFFFFLIKTKDMRVGFFFITEMSSFSFVKQGRKSRSWHRVWLGCRRKPEISEESYREHAELRAGNKPELRIKP